MKTRLGFVSNSSSSSFVISKDVLSTEQIYKIKNHIKLGKDKGLYGFDREFAPCEDCDAWDIRVTDDEIIGFTAMDNFIMSSYLKDIGVADEDITWEDGLSYLWEEWEKNNNEN